MTISDAMIPTKITTLLRFKTNGIINKPTMISIFFVTEAINVFFGKFIKAVYSDSNMDAIVFSASAKLKLATNRL